MSVPLKYFWLGLLLGMIGFQSCKKDDSVLYPSNNSSAPQLFIPTAFTPNGDNVNDSFIVKGSNISFYRISIYDSENTQLYSSGDIMAGWDGSYKGKAVPSGSYLWVIDYKDMEATPYKKTGYVEVVR
jgi:gliding motility-associated-like protein